MWCGTQLHVSCETSFHMQLVKPRILLNSYYEILQKVVQPVQMQSGIVLLTVI